MERIVIAAYKPFPGKEKELKELMNNHLTILRNENLVSYRDSIIMEAKDGTVLEVFGWKSKEAIESAHNNEMVRKMWDEYARVCEFIPFGNIAESRDLFSEFSPL